MNLEELRALAGISHPTATDEQSIVNYIIDEDIEEICQVLLDRGNFLPERYYLRRAAQHDSIRCFKLFLKRGAKADEDILYQAIWKGAREVPKLLLLSGFYFRLHKPIWVKLYQRCLAVRQLARRATERALQHVGVCKDMALMIGQMLVASSEVYTHWEQVMTSKKTKKIESKRKTTE
jgi:hypothetical protein